MIIDDLLNALQKVKDKHGGKTEVKVSSFCGTNNNSVLFDLKKFEEHFDVADTMNDLGELVLTVEISQSTIDRIKQGVAEMEEKGYRFYRSQFCKRNEQPMLGLSPCEWHVPW